MIKQIFEKILILVTILGLTLKLLNINGGNIIFTLAIFLLAIFYFLATFFFLNNISIRESIKGQKINVKTSKIIGSAGFGLGISAILVGLMFNILNWPGYSTNVYLGLVVTLTIVIISIIRIIKSKSRYYLPIIIRGIIYSIIAIAILILPDYWSVDVQYKDYPDYKNAVIEYYNNPTDTTLMRQMDIEYEKMIEKNKK